MIKTEIAPAPRKLKISPVIAKPLCLTFFLTIPMIENDNPIKDRRSNNINN